MGVFWAIIVAFGICFQALVLNSQNLTCDSNDLKALQEFLGILETAIDGWGTNSSHDCCEWPGITCNSGRVVKLELGKGRLIGRVTPSIGTLDRLITLNLTHNMLKGSLPVSLFALRYLEILDLSSNQLAGPLPSSINLPALKYLDISQNLLNGSMPASICENSTSISVLNVAENQFFGYLPPELENCHTLEVLSLGMNGFSGGISEEIFKLQNLTQLSLQGNNLSGPLSEGIGSLTGLVQFDISSNQFTGKIPDVFHGFEKLQDFIAHSNKFTGSIPPSLTNSSTLSLLSLRNNSLGGQIGLNCSAMTNLMGLDLGSNQFIGPIPENLPSCLRLNTVNLARNNFSSHIPESFKNFHSLSHLSLSNASLYNLSSAVNTLQWCRNLSTLILTLNFRNEELPADPSLRFENLKVLVIANCRLTGSIPPWLSSSGDLHFLDLSWNRLEGTIPVWFGSFVSLFYVDLSNNSFTGEIPKSIAGLPSFTNRNTSLEEPSPVFPLFSKKNASTKGLQYNQVLSFPPTLDLSYNNLRGSIWPEFGRLEKLLILDLKFNNLSGPIPSTLSGMLSLEVLDLSHNDLSGQIPNSLENLSFLSTFNVAYNHLYGPIPAKGQFLTFPNSSFEGNDLCGDHIFSCLSIVRVPPNSTKSRRNRATIVGMVVGIVFGTFALFLMLMILLRGNVPSEVDPEKEEPEGCNEEAEDSESRLVVMFQTKENNKVLCLEDLLKSTNNFDQANIVGCGGFGLVYKAILPDGRKVAIKRLSGDCQMDREFRAEVEALSRAQHPNLVYLQGYCMYKNDRLLIYSYMENSSLDYWLHENLDGPSFLDWDKRLQIAQGAARGLAYLHQSCEPHILHRDIKSSNILLDENFEAHLADFGLARLMLPYDTHVTTDLVGTLGYIPPEYGQAPVATYKGDVYSFGVVLLELVTGKRPMDICKRKGARDLISWVFQMKNENRETEVFDPFVYEKENGKEMKRVLDIACLCLSESPKVRPSTQQIVSWLNNIKTNM